jgi:hypothetical protein
MMSWWSIATPRPNKLQEWPRKSLEEKQNLVKWDACEMDTENGRKIKHGEAAEGKLTHCPLTAPMQQFESTLCESPGQVVEQAKLGTEHERVIVRSA